MSWELVTPEQAKAWLENHNPHNRSLREVSVNAFAQDMRTKRWSPNHQGIAFNDQGNLIDGQHRLAAIVMSGVSIWLLVFRNVPERVEGVAAAVMETVDRGNARSLADLLRLEHGIKEEPNVVAAALLNIARMCINHPQQQAKRATMPQIALVLEQFGPSVKWAMTMRPPQVGLRSTILWASMAFAHMVKPREVVAFAQRIVSGAGLSIDSPALTLRNEILRGVLETSAVISRWNNGAKVLAAIKADIEGQPMRSLPADHNAAPVLQWWRDWQTSRVQTVAAAFPLLKPIDEKRTNLSTRKTVAHLKPTVAVPPPAPAPVTKASELKVTPAAERLLGKR